MKDDGKRKRIFLTAAGDNLLFFQEEKWVEKDKKLHEKVALKYYPFLPSLSLFLVWRWETEKKGDEEEDGEKIFLLRETKNYTWKGRYFEMQRMGMKDGV